MPRWDEQARHWVAPNGDVILDLAGYVALHPNEQIHYAAPAQPPDALNLGRVGVLDFGLVRDAVNPAPLDAPGEVFLEPNVFGRRGAPIRARRRNPRMEYIARNRDGVQIMAEYAAAGVLVAAPEEAEAPEGAHCVPLDGGVPGYLVCHYCSWLYETDRYVVYNNRDYVVCKTCFPKVSACQTCGGEQTVEQFTRGRNGNCPECVSPGQLHVMQRTKFKPKSKILKARGGTVWNSVNPISGPIQNSSR
jgi:hypothetical protein